MGPLKWRHFTVLVTRNPNYDSRGPFCYYSRLFVCSGCALMFEHLNPQPCCLWPDLEKGFADRQSLRLTVSPLGYSQLR